MIPAPSWQRSPKNSTSVSQSDGPGRAEDNAQPESFWSTLKNEFCQRHQFLTRAEAVHAVSSWIHTFYNHRGRHGALGQLPPVAFERRITTAATQSA